MVDTHTTQQRSYNMSRIRSTDTRPEIVVRTLAHHAGYRYRLYVADLPGRPDLVFPRLKRVIFIHGCFWHAHNCRYGRVRPKTNARYWEAKRLGNRERDREHIRELKRSGWNVLVVWECWTRDRDHLRERLLRFLTG